MSKRRKTPDLPSMDDLLSAGSSANRAKSGKTSKSQNSSESDNRVKVTYYLPGDLVDRIDEAHFKLGRMSRGTDIKIHKYDMARIAWELVLAEFEEKGEQSYLVSRLLDS